ncbi:transposable element Tcb2 transposase [Trichonephila clavipes]|nr:transposable element Tcb2 transposase [Trichonephila clavipes]
MQRLPGTLFQQDNARPYTARVSQDCLCTVTTVHWPSRSPDVSPIEHICDHLGWRVGYPKSLNELDVSYSKYGTKSLKTLYRTCLNPRSYRIVHSR